VAAEERELGYQSPEGDLKDVFTEDSDSGDDNDRRKKLYVMYGGSWELTSRRNVKSLRREVLSATSGVPKAAPHQWWRSTTISFGASDCPDNMAGAGVLPLITAPVIANMRLHHVLIDGGAGLNVISHAAFKQLQILGSRLGPSRPFSRVSPQPVYPLGNIALPVTFGTEENFHTENIVFDVAEVNLPFNAIIGMPTLYRFMAIAHYGYLVLKMPSPTEVLTVQGDHAATLAAVEKLHALAAEIARPDDGGGTPSTPGTKALPKVPKVQPSGADDVPVKAIQLTVDSTQTTRIAGDLGEK
jgi:ribonuclease HI